MARVVVSHSSLPGLATAIRLASRGHSVLLLEPGTDPLAEQQPFALAGWRLHPTAEYLTLPHVWADLFSAAGQRIEDHLDLVSLQPPIRFLFHDGSTFDAFTQASGVDRLREEVRRISPRDADTFTVWMRSLRRLFDALYEGPWRSLNATPLDWATSVGASRALFRIHRLFDPRSAAQVAGTRWHHPLLARAFSELTRHLGTTPHTAPAVALWSVYAFLRFGAWVPVEGLPALRRSLLRVAESAGVRIVTQQEAVRLEIRTGRLAGVATSAGQVWPCDAFVWAGAPQVLESILRASGHRPGAKRGGLTTGTGAAHVMPSSMTDPDHPDARPAHPPHPGPARLAPRSPRSEALARFRIFLVARGTFPGLAYQTVLLSENGRAESETQARWGAASYASSVTITHLRNITGKISAPPDLSPFVVRADVPVESRRFQWTDPQRLEFRRFLVTALDSHPALAGLRASVVAEHCPHLPAGIAPPMSAIEEPPDDTTASTPPEQPLTASELGATSDGLSGVFRRLPNRLSALPGVFCVGPSYHPGPTPPQVLLGARNIAEAISKGF